MKIEDWEQYSQKYSNIKEIMNQFNITNEEINIVGLNKLEELIIERISLIDYIL